MTIVLLGVLPEGEDDFVDRQVWATGCSSQSAARRFPLGNDAGVLLTGFGRVVLAEQHVTTAAVSVGQSDDGLARLTVETVGGYGIARTGHQCSSLFCG